MAAGQTLLSVRVDGMDGPTGNLATPDTRGTHPVLDFDATTDESCMLRALMPENYSGGGIQVRLRGSFSSAVADEARFDVSFDKNVDMDAETYDTVNSMDITAPANNGDPVAQTVNVAAADLDGIVAGDWFSLLIVRDANHANDDAAGDFELGYVDLVEL